MAGLNGSPGNLAQCVPALARASQLLCTVSQPNQARDALQQAAGLLDGNGRFTDITAVKQLADRCLLMAQTGAEGQLVASCRQLGASMARQMTTLTQQIQQLSKAPARAVAPVPPSPKPAVKVSEKPVETPAAAAQPKPAEQPVPVPEPVPVTRPKPVQPAVPGAPVQPTGARPRPPAKPAPAAAPKVPEEARPVGKTGPVPKPEVVPGMLERITVARTAAEKAAVAAALQKGKRLAVVGNGTVIDTRTNRMWVGRLGPVTPFRGAQSYAENLRLGNYADWRLPSPEELQQLMAEGGREDARLVGLFASEQGSGAEWLWTSQSRRRFWFFGRLVTCMSFRGGQFSPQKAGAARVAALAIRAAG